VQIDIETRAMRFCIERGEDGRLVEKRISRRHEFVEPPGADAA
jgi:hypothetical protein